MVEYSGTYQIYLYFWLGETCSFLLLSSSFSAAAIVDSKSKLAPPTPSVAASVHFFTARAFLNHPVLLSEVVGCVVREFLLTA